MYKKNTLPTSGEEMIKQMKILVWWLGEKIARKIDAIVNGKSIWRFERILSLIIGQKLISHFDEKSSYYETLRVLDDIEDDIYLITDTWVYYTVKDYPHIRFSRRELEEIGDRFTQLRIPELL